MSSETEFESMNLQLDNSSHAELVDFLYDYAGKNRLTVLWFGWYQVEHARQWYERSGEPSNFKIKLELLSEENGFMFFTSHPDQSKIGALINYGDKKKVWLDLVDDFEQELAAQGWRLESLK